MKLPEKEYLQFDELKVKWACSTRDLFHLIATAKLTPSTMARGLHDPYQLLPSSDGSQGLEISGFIEDLYSASQEFLSGIYYLNFMNLESPNDCSFKYLSSKRNPGEFDIIFGIDRQAIIESDHLSQVVKFKGDFIFVREEIERFEREHMQPATATEVAQEPREKPLATRERNTLLRIIHALSKSNQLDLSQPFKAAESVKTTLDLLGCSLSIDTIAAKLKEASES